jgi:hypothetical protein
MPLQAITVRYCGPTNHNGSRLIARAEAGRVVVGWDHSLNTVDNYTRAAMTLAERFGWTAAESAVIQTGWAMASLPGKDKGYVFVPLIPQINIIDPA